MKRIVVFSGAGMSAESGINTFRDSDGLWEKHNVEDVATPEAWKKNPELVLDFYNQRRFQVLKAEPNAAHKALLELESKYDVVIVTQNIDNLHERSGSSNVVHLHGEIMKARSVNDPNNLFDVTGPIYLNDLAQDGGQLRPHVVWFGESVPSYEIGKTVIESADILIIVGTSLNVYPAAGLVTFAKPGIQKFLIDPEALSFESNSDLTLINQNAGVAIPRLVKSLLAT
jgi:NAD-dependent deacetylase